MRHCVTTLVFGGAISVLGHCSRQGTVSSLNQHTCNLHIDVCDEKCYLFFFKPIFHFNVM